MSYIEKTLFVRIALIITLVISFDPRREVRIVTKPNNKYLVAARDFKPGESIVQVPVDYCLLTRRDGCCRGLQGQTDLMWESAGDLRNPIAVEDESLGRTWDLNLALALMEATAGTANAMASNFWDDYYSYLLPPSESITLPFCASEVFLRRYTHVTTVADAAVKQKKRLFNLFPSLVESHSFHRLSQRSLEYMKDNKDLVPSPLEWAFGVVRSRCFQVSEDWFAIVPIIDMCNHDFNPNAFVAIPNRKKDKLTSQEGGESGGAEEERNSQQSIALEALRPIAAGEEITISYGDDYTNQRLYAQYGFVDSLNPRDCVTLPPLQLSPELVELVLDSMRKQAFFSVLQKISELLLQSKTLLASTNSHALHTPTRMEAALRSLVQRLEELVTIVTEKSEEGDGFNVSLDNPSNSNIDSINDNNYNEKTVDSFSQNAEVHVLVMQALLSDITATLSSYPTDYLSDERLLVELRETVSPIFFDATVGEAVNRAQLEACVAFRLEYKRVCQCMADVIKGGLVSSMNQ